MNDEINKLSLFDTDIFVYKGNMNGNLGKLCDFFGDNKNMIIMTYISVSKEVEKMKEKLKKELALNSSEQNLKLIDKNKYIKEQRIFLAMDVANLPNALNYFLKNFNDKKMRMTLYECIVKGKSSRFYLDIEADNKIFDGKKNKQAVMQNIITFSEIYLQELLKDSEKLDIYHIIFDASDEKKFSKHVTFFIFDQYQQELFFESNSVHQYTLKGFFEFFQSSSESFELDDDFPSKIKYQTEQGYSYFFLDEGDGKDKMMFYHENGEKKSFIDFCVFDGNRMFRNPFFSKIGFDDDYRPLILERVTLEVFDEFEKNYLSSLRKGKNFFDCILNEEEKIENIKRTISLLLENTHLIEFFFIRDYHQDSGKLQLNIERRLFFLKEESANKGNKKRKSIFLNDQSFENQDKKEVAKKGKSLMGLEFFKEFQKQLDIDLSKKMMEVFIEISKNLEKENENLRPCFTTQRLEWMRNETTLIASSRNKFCPKINREHHSNHVYVLINFKTTKIEIKCHDYDCEQKITNQYRIEQIIRQSPQKNKILEAFYSTLDCIAIYSIKNMKLSQKNMENRNEKSKKNLENLLNDF